MFTVKIGGLRWVFLNTTRTIKDLLEKRAAVFFRRNALTLDLQLKTSHAISSRYYVWGQEVLPSQPR
jgi:hypothetical protein